MYDREKEYCYSTSCNYYLNYRMCKSPYISYELHMDYDLFGYYVNSEGEYQRLLLDSKGNFFRRLLDPNSDKICTWFFEQQSAWDLDVYEP